MNITRQVLISTRTLLSDKSKWTQNHFARDKNDIPIPSWWGNLKKGDKFCVLGATMRCGQDQRQTGVGKNESQAILVLDRVATKYFHGQKPAQVNDHLGYEETMRLLDLAITEATDERYSGDSY